MFNWFIKIIKEYNKPRLQIVCEYSFKCFWRNRGVSKNYSEWLTEPFQVSRRLEKALEKVKVLEKENFLELLPENESTELQNLCHNRMGKEAVKYFGRFSGITFSITSYKILFKKEGKLNITWMPNAECGILEDK